MKFRIFSNHTIDEISMVVAYRKLNISYEFIKQELDLEANSLTDYTSHVYQNNPSAFDKLSRFLSYEKLLEMDGSFRTFDQDLKRSIIKRLWYPVLLLLVLYAILSLFIFRLYPSLSALLTDLSIQSTTYTILYGVLVLVFIVLTGSYLFLLFGLVFLLSGCVGAIIIASFMISGK